MEKKHPDLDNIFRKEISDYELSKTKDNWDLLSHLLNEQDRKKKNRKLILFFFSFFTILSTGLFIFLPSKQNAEKEIALPANPTTITKSPSVFHSSESEAPQPAIANQPQENGNEKGSENNSQPISPSTTPSHSGAIETKQNVHTAIIKHSTIANNSNTVKHLSINPEIYLTQETPTVIQDSNKTILSETQMSKSGVSDLPITESNDLISATAPTNEIVNQNPIASDSINANTNNDSSTAVVRQYSPGDSITNEKHSTHFKLITFNFYAGINIYTTSSAARSKQENISPLIGLEFVHSNASHFGIGLGGLYSFQGGYHLSDTASNKNYFLEENTSQQTIQIRQLHKLYFPLMLYYAIAPKHTVSAGAQLSYLLSTNGYYTETNKVSGVTTESTKRNVTGYQDGIKSINYSVSVGYKYSLSKTFDWSTRITRELSDSYTKDYFYGINTKPSFSIQSFLIFKF